jgi:HEAT repeat protein
MRTLALALLLAATSAFAQAPRIQRATVTTAPAAADLGAQVRGSKTPWIGYSVPAVDGYRVMCCFDRWGDFKSGGTCRLSDDASSFTNTKDDELRPAAGSIAVVYRIENGAVDKVRTYSLDCTLDGGGSTALTWIDGVDPHKSVALLASLVGGEKSASKRALSALAMHDEASAGDRLEAWARSSTASDSIRGEAVFWLAETRPERGLEAARQLARDTSASRKVREKAVFALSLIKTAPATDELIRIAKTDDDSHVRGQALFWLSQQAGKKAAGAIREAVDRDADSHVREKAVFAVSQLPGDEGIPILIDLMKNHRDPNVRKKAAFWLGQKRDPRALNALEEILRR